MKEKRGRHEQMAYMRGEWVQMEGIRASQSSGVSSLYPGLHAAPLELPSIPQGGEGGGLKVEGGWNARIT